MTARNTIDSASLMTAANALEADMVRFLREMIAIPGESSHEGPVIQRIKQEKERVGFDEIRIDGLGNIVAVSADHRLSCLLKHLLRSLHEYSPGEIG